MLIVQAFLEPLPPVTADKALGACGGAVAFPEGSALMDRDGAYFGAVSLVPPC
jgi:hypothetical protein